LLSSAVVDGLVLVVVGVVGGSGWVVVVEAKPVTWQSQTTGFGEQRSAGRRMSPLGY
jgi:purine nucleoside phosphorylase